VAERIAWMEHAHGLPQFERFPPQESSACLHPRISMASMGPDEAGMRIRHVV
jgi:hypothetical protein